MPIEQCAKEALAKERAQKRLEALAGAGDFFEGVFAEKPAILNLADDYNGAVLIQHEGHSFWCYEPDEKEHIFLVWRGTCPECGDEADGQYFTDAAGFGLALEQGWYPSDWHIEECNKPG